MITGSIGAETDVDSAAALRERGFGKVHLFILMRDDPVAEFPGIGKRLFHAVIELLRNRELRTITHEREIVGNLLAALLTEHRIEYAFLGIDAAAHATRCSVKIDITGREKPITVRIECIQERTIAHFDKLRSNGTHAAEHFRKDGAVCIKHAHPVGKIDIHAGNGEFIEHTLEHGSKLFRICLLYIECQHGRIVFLFEFRAQFFRIRRNAAVEQNNIGFSQCMQFGLRPFLRRLIRRTRKIGDTSVRCNKDSDGGMIADDPTRPVLRRLIEGNFLLAPGRLYKARHAVFLKSRRSFYRITHAVNEPHPCDSVLHFEFRRLFGDKLWLGGHDGASACRLRQFVRVTLFLCACHLREHQLLHELFDECGLARSDGTDNADIDVSARPRCNVLIYAE